MILYQNDKDIETIYNTMFQLLEREEILEILNVNYSFVVINYNNQEIMDLLKSQGISSFISPITLFVHDSLGLFSNNKGLVLKQLDGCWLEIETLCQYIVECLNNLDSSSGNKNPYIDNDVNLKFGISDDNLLSNVELLEKQKRQLEEMEKQAYEQEMKKNEEERKKQELRLEKEKSLLRLKKKISMDRKNKEEIRKQLRDEPPTDEKNAAFIKFRLPDGSIKERKFMKTWKIEELYKFINSLDNVLVEEETDYDLITPFPNKVYDDYEKTIEEEGLYPNSMLQVREK